MHCGDHYLCFFTEIIRIFTSSTIVQVNVFSSFAIDSSIFCRTVLDLTIAILHIVSLKLVQKDDDANRDASCKVLGALLQFALFASSGWYVTLAAELFFLIRNPFR